MDISKLTIQGFKSFYEKSVFTFDTKITGIVGPNGSGKSNITDAIRFVLGEQSTKSMRGKDATDMLFRGNTAKSSKAVVTIEFVKSTNNASLVKINTTENIFIKNALEKDVVTISRSIFADGKSAIEMNGVEIRNKDLQEFLLYIHLGNKSSWHISQGEADRVLQANTLERKTLIEDALGLKIYHSRINEAEKKTEKTKENIREATVSRKEMMPELTVLAKQVEKIKRSQEFRTELTEKAQTFLSYKNLIFETSKKELNSLENISDLQYSLNTLGEQILQKEKSLYKDGSHDVAFLENEFEKENRIFVHVQNEFRQYENKVGSLKNNLEYLSLEQSRYLQEVTEVESEKRNIGSIGNDIIFSEKDLNATRDIIDSSLEKISQTNGLGLIKESVKEIDFSFKKFLTKGSVVSKDNVKQISYLQNIRTRAQEKIQRNQDEKQKYEKELLQILPQLDNTKLKLEIVTKKCEDYKSQILEFKFKKADAEREVQRLVFERSQLQVKISQHLEFAEKIKSQENEFKQDLQEFKNILGESFEFVSGNILNENDFHALRRNIERLKIRLEESVVTNPDEVVKSFENMTERDGFLIKEISDLEKAMLNLQQLIIDLKLNLKKEFDLGLELINTIFDAYVKRLFGGGAAKVFQVEIEPRKSETQAETESEDEEVPENKLGIEVEVELPKKKVKGLQSLSGGERALVSIALNFSIINQNPAPFMILDETDAALDEANSKRYGEILDMLKEKTKLIVVTHNRETMHFSNQVYGVTLHKDGYSKVLSVSFEDAIEYAK